MKCGIGQPSSLWSHSLRAKQKRFSFHLGDIKTFPGKNQISISESMKRAQKNKQRICAHHTHNRNSQEGQVASTVQFRSSPREDSHIIPTPSETSLASYLTRERRNVTKVLINMNYSLALRNKTMKR